MGGRRIVFRSQFPPMGRSLPRPILTVVGVKADTVLERRGA
ncbi:hypothetical protein OKW40_005710 [Paraburkholderia sp. RAU6.4a]